MVALPYIRNSVRLTVLILLSVAASLVLTGVVPVSSGTGSAIILVLAIMLTDLLYEYSPESPDSRDEPQPPDGPEPDLDTDSLITDAWWGDQ